MSTLVWDLVQLQRLTGTRAGKLLQLTPAKLDRTGDVWQYNVDGHKTVHHGHSGNSTFVAASFSSEATSSG